MPALISLFLRWLGVSIVPYAWKVIRGLGFTAVSYVGITTALDQVKDLAISKLTSVPAEWINILGLLQVDVCLSLLISALLARAVVRGVSKTGEKKSMSWGG